VRFNTSTVTPHAARCIREFVHSRGPESASGRPAPIQALHASQMTSDLHSGSATSADWVIPPTWAVCRVKFCHTRAVSPLLTGALVALPSESSYGASHGYASRVAGSSACSTHCGGLVRR
jgi:hypothetical protein